MKRWLLPLTLAVTGLGLVVSGYLLPARVGAVDSAVLRSAVTNELEKAGRQYLRSEKIGPARLLHEVLERSDRAAAEGLGREIDKSIGAYPLLVPWGGADRRLEQLLSRTGQVTELQRRSLAELLLDPDSRTNLRAAIASSRRPAVLAVLNTRTMGTAYFSPATSPGGQPLEAAMVLTALLLEGDYLSGALVEAIEQLTARALATGALGRLEDLYLHLLALAVRLDWLQLTEFIKHVPEVETLKVLTEQSRNEMALSTVAAAVYLSGTPARVAAYLTAHPQTALADLSYSAVRGRAALATLLRSQKVVHYGPSRPAWLTRSFLAVTGGAEIRGVMVRWTLVFVGLFLLFGGTAALARPGAARAGSWRARTLPSGVWAFGCLVLVVILDESFVAKASPMVEPLPNWQFAAIGATVKQAIDKPPQAIMDMLSVISLVGFLVVQGAIYLLCLRKLTEIRRESLPTGVKLRLLENEENMFDAGLYVGLGGTVLSLVFLSLGIIKPSLVAAYSSTLFGILFVSILKICHVRPFRRKLILEGPEG